MAAPLDPHDLVTLEELTISNMWASELAGFPNNPGIQDRPPSTLRFEECSQHPYLTQFGAAGQRGCATQSDQQFVS